MLPSIVRRSNDKLLVETGSLDGVHGRLAWQNSVELWRTVHKHDANGPVYDFVCGCGVNRVVHAPACISLSVPRPVLENFHVAPDLLSPPCWVVCRWFPSPEDGFYIPLTVQIKQPEGGWKRLRITIPLELPDLVYEATESVIQQWRSRPELAEISEASDRARERREWTQPIDPRLGTIHPERSTPPPGSIWSKARAAFRDKLVGHVPGAKANVSYPSTRKPATSTLPGSAKKVIVTP